MPCFDLCEYEETLDALLVGELVYARAVDHSFPFLGGVLVVPGEAAVIAEADECSLAAMAVRPGADHGLTVVQEHRRRVAVVQIRGTCRHYDLPLLLSRDVRPRQVALIPLGQGGESGQEYDGGKCQSIAKHFRAALE